MQTSHTLAIAFISLATLAPLHAAEAAGGCAKLATFSMPGHRVLIRKAEDVPASAPGVSPAVPAHCRVEGVIDERQGRDAKTYGIGFAVALPVQWNGRFLFQGGGGLNGSVQPPLGAAFTAGKSAVGSHSPQLIHACSKMRSMRRSGSAAPHSSWSPTVKAPR